MASHSLAWRFVSGSRSTLSKLAPVLLAAAGVAALLTEQAQAGVTTAGCVGATSCTLQELFDGGTITADGLLFESFELDGLEMFSTVPDWTRITLTGLDDGGTTPGPGLRVDGGGELAVGPLDFIEFAFGYEVKALDPLRPVTSNVVQVAGGEHDAGTDGRWEVDQRVRDANLATLGNEHVFADSFFRTQDLEVRIEVAARDSLSIGTAVYLEDFVGGAVSLDGFTQRFSRVVVPLPASVWMLAAAIASLIAVRRRRAHQP